MTTAALRSVPAADPPNVDPYGADQPFDWTAVAERAYVGALVLVAPEVRARLLELVRDVDIVDAQCRWMAGSIRAMVAAGQPVDAVTVVGWARRNASVGMAQADRIASWLVEVTANVPVALSAEFYAGQIVEAGSRREIAAVGSRLLAASDTAALDHLDEVVRAACEAARNAVERAIAALA